MGKTSQEFDEHLFSLKLREPSHELQEQSGAIAKGASRTSKGFFSHNGLIQIVDGYLADLRRWLELIDQLCREVWQTQGKMVTPDFLRDVLVPKALTTIEIRKGVIKERLGRALFGSPENPYASQHHLAMEVNRLKAEVANRYEIEARELEYRNVPSRPEIWRSLSEECKRFHEEESQIVRATRKERLCADCDFVHSSLTLDKESILNLRTGPDQRLKAEFETCATRAGIVLGCPKDISPLRFWLYNLFLFLYKTKSPHLFAPNTSYTVGPEPQSDSLKPHAGETIFSVGGIITNVWEASATFCLWLQKQALEAQHNTIGTERLRTDGKQPEPSLAESNGKTVQSMGIKSTSKKPEPCDPEVAKRRAVVRSNADVSDVDMVEIFDREQVSLPWQYRNAGFKTWGKVYKDRKYRTRIHTMISKDRRQS